MPRGLSEMILPRRPMARRAERISETPMPAPARRAERMEAIEPEAAPETEAAEPEFVRVLIVDPYTQTIADARLPVEEGEEANGYGTQVTQSALNAVIGSKSLGFTELADGLSAIHDEADPDMAWSYGEDGEEITGRSLICGHDPETDAYVDVPLTIDEATEQIRWGGADDETMMSADARAGVPQPGAIPYRR